MHDVMAQLRSSGGLWLLVRRGRYDNRTSSMYESVLRAKKREESRCSFLYSYN